VKLIAVVVALAGCASTPRATCGDGWAALSRDRGVPRTGIQRREPRFIEKVEIAGVDARLASTLKSELQTKPGLVLDDAPLQDDLRRLWKLGVIEDASVAVDDGNVTFVLQPRRTITNVVRKGGDALAQSRFRQLAATPFEPSRLQRMTEALEESYVRMGHIDAHVEAKQRVHATGVDVCVATNPGPRVTIGKLEFPGAKAVAAKTLREVLHGKDANVNRIGGSFDPAALEFDEMYLTNEYYERGHLDVKIGKPEVARRGRRLDVKVPIYEGPRYRLGHIGAPIATALEPGTYFKRSQISAAIVKLQEDLGADAVYPNTAIDRETLRVDIEFQIEWRYPWDAVRFWLSQSR